MWDSVLRPWENSQEQGRQEPCSQIRPSFYPVDFALTKTLVWKCFNESTFLFLPIPWSCLDQGPQKSWCLSQPLKNEQSLDRQRKNRDQHSRQRDQEGMVSWKCEPCAGSYHWTEHRGHGVLSRVVKLKRKDGPLRDLGFQPLSWTFVLCHLWYGSWSRLSFPTSCFQLVKIHTPVIAQWGWSPWRILSTVT